MTDVMFLGITFQCIPVVLEREGGAKLLDQIE